MSTETTTPKPIETQIAEWSAERAEIAALVATTDGITVAGHTEGPKAGREAVHAALMPLWRRRCALDNREKEFLEIPKTLAAKIKAAKIDLAAPLVAAEDRLRADRDAYDAEQAKIAAEKKAEEDRLAAIAAEEARAILQAKVERVTALGGIPNLAQLQLISDEAFAALVAELAEAQAAKIAREAKEKADREEADRIAREQREAKEAEERRAQAEQREKEAAEAKRRRDEEDRAAAERKRLQDIEDTRLEQERAELRKEREAQEAERKRLQEEADKIRRDREEEESRVRREQERKEAEAEAERERIEAAEREAAEAARIETEKPDREKIAAFALAWKANRPSLPTIESETLQCYLDTLTSDLGSRLGITIHEMQEDA
jgi:hypothetical protein